VNSVSLMVALMAVPDAAAFGGRNNGCCDPCGKQGLFGGRIRAFFAKCNLFNKCRSKNACWAPPSGCCGGGGFEVGSMMGGGGFDGMPMGGMAMGGMPMGDGMMMGDGMTGGMPMGMGGQPGGYCPGCAAGQQQQAFGGMPYGGMAMAQPYQQGGMPAQGGEYNAVQPTYGAVSGYPAQMPSGQGGFTAPPSQTWMANPQRPAPVLNNPTPVPQSQSVPNIPVPTPIPAGSGAMIPQGPFQGTAPAAAVVAAYATGGEDFAPAKLRFTVPAGAVVYVDGQKVDGNGPVRKFHTPTLPRGRTFFYEFKAEVEVNGVKVVEEKVLPVCAGDDLSESFAKLTASAK
jgi:uncharacterized protein (TIGR03000 family)